MSHSLAGNSWAAAGMLRVLGTIQRSQFAKSMKNEQNDLIAWVDEIHTAMYPHLVRHTPQFTLIDYIVNLPGLEKFRLVW